MPNVTRPRSLASSVEPLFAAIWLGSPLGELLRATPEPLDTSFPDDGVPNTALMDGNQLALARRLYRDGHPRLARFVSALVLEADAILKGADDEISGAPGSDDAETALLDEETSETTVRFLADPDLAERSENLILLALAAYLSSEERFATEAARGFATLLADPTVWRRSGYGGFKLRRSDLAGGVWADALRHLAALTDALRLLDHTGRLADAQGAAAREWFKGLSDWLDATATRGAATTTASARSLDLTHAIIREFAASFPAASQAGNNDGNWSDALAGATQVRSPRHAATRVSAMGLVLNASVQVRGLQNELDAGAREGMQDQLDQAKADARALADENRQLLRYASDLRRRYAMILSSRAWLLTAPLRETGRLLKSALTGRAIPRASVPPEPVVTEGRGADFGERAGVTASPRGLPLRPRGAAASLAARFVSRHASPSDHLARLQALRPANEEALEAAYAASPISRQPDTFVLTRIIGNDLVPRHRKGQSRDNVRFVLENEPALDDCEKRWVVNRLFDEDEEARIVALLEEHGQPYTRLPFEPDVYRSIAWDEDGLLSPTYLSSDAFAGLREDVQERARVSRYRLKNNYAMNNNGARNIALDDGRGRAKWVMPWDGNCFLTQKGWEAIRASVTARPHLKYFAVPMERMTDNTLLLSDGFEPNPVEEPQMIFRADALERFDETIPYGRRPKVELFWRLGLKGPWDAWGDDPWDRPRAPLSAEAGQFGVAGWVARMFSGNLSQEQSDNDSRRNRTLARQDAVTATLDTLDARLASGLPERTHPSHHTNR